MNISFVHLNRFQLPKFRINITNKTFLWGITFSFNNCISSKNKCQIIRILAVLIKEDQPIITQDHKLLKVD